MARRRDAADWLIKPLPTLLALAVGVGAGVAVASARSTELGDTTSTPTYGAEAPVVQFSTTPGTKPYATPDGVLTSWRYHSSLDSPAGTVRLELFKPLAGEGVYEAVAASDAKPLEPGTPYEFSERIPVEQGWVLGLDPGDAEVGIAVSSAADQMYQFISDVPVGVTQTATGPFPNYRVNVSATVEPDADGDGYGDETQDDCPTDASTQGPCPPDTDPPETEITKGAPNKLDKSKVKFKFTADEPNVTFECKLDQKPYKPCTSPKKVKRLDDGKHKFKVIATDEAGNSDPSAAKDKFKVVD